MSLVNPTQEIEVNGAIFSITADPFDGAIEGEITDSDGYTITPITFTLNGNIVDDSTVNIKAKHGKDGTTPIKGTDYFTQSDKEEFIESVTPVIENLIDIKIGEIINDTY